MGIVVGIFVLCIIVILFIPPVPQWDEYHKFSDTRSRVNIPNFGDVMSNAGFLLAGLFGLVKTIRNGLFDTHMDRIPYLIFFVGVTLTGIGSGYYHWAPSNDTLFWDRLPMTVAFMSFFAAVVSDRINRKFGIFLVLPVLLIAGAYSVIYWQLTEAEGAGDLRIYGMVQFFPLVAIPVIIWLYRDYRYTDGRMFSWIACFYICSKLLEYFDEEVFNLLNYLISGHSLKHLTATIAAFMVLQMLKSAHSKIILSD